MWIGSSLFLNLPCPLFNFQSLFQLRDLQLQPIGQMQPITYSRNKVIFQYTVMSIHLDIVSGYFCDTIKLNSYNRGCSGHKNIYHFILWHKFSSLEKTLILGKIEGKRRRGQQRMRLLDGITDSMDMSLSKLQGIVHEFEQTPREAWSAVVV